MIDEKFREQSHNLLLVRQGELQALRAAIRLVTFHAFSIRRKIAEGGHIEDGPLILSFDPQVDMDEFFQDSTPFVDDIANLAVFDRRDLEPAMVDQMQQRVGEIRAKGLREE